VPRGLRSPRSQCLRATRLIAKVAALRLLPARKERAEIGVGRHDDPVFLHRTPEQDLIVLFLKSNLARVQGIVSRATKPRRHFGR